MEEVRWEGVWFSSWYVVSIDTGHIAQSPQSGPRWSPAFKMEPVLFPPSVGIHSWFSDGLDLKALITRVVAVNEVLAVD